MADIAELKADLAKAEAAKEKLLDERRSNRVTMTKAEFAAYSDGTIADQKQVQKAISEAQDAVTAFLNNARQEIFVGTVSESDGSGGVN